MSYIHQALKKAQVERDRRNGQYEGVISPSRSKKGGASKRWILIGAATVGILSLAFVGYSWLDLRAGRPVTEAPSRPIADTKTPRLDNRPDAESLYKTGKTHHTAGRLNEARGYYEKALQVDPGLVTALNNLGVILLAEKDYAGARSRLEKAVRLKPDYVDPCYNLACLFALTGQPEQAGRYLKRAVSLDPRAKLWALEDPDLTSLRSEPGFEDILDENHKPPNP
jgi:tetratricopeptide (TPR) repeat protein